MSVVVFWRWRESPSIRKRPVCSFQAACALPARPAPAFLIKACALAFFWERGAVTQAEALVHNLAVYGFLSATPCYICKVTRFHRAISRRVSIPESLRFCGLSTCYEFSAFFYKIWRWRESNPRPDTRYTGVYRFSRLLGCRGGLG